jgi:RimJ/RimL family protein N-acetyltransferase
VEIVKTRPLYAHVAKHNVGSRRVLEKCGFKVIGEDSYTNPGGVKVEEFVLKLDEN